MLVKLKAIEFFSKPQEVFIKMLQEEYMMDDRLAPYKPFNTRDYQTQQGA